MFTTIAIVLLSGFLILFLTIPLLMPKGEYDKFLAETDERILRENKIKMQEMAEKARKQRVEDRLYKAKEARWIEEIERESARRYRPFAFVLGD
jgi:uncharacterized ion transporter superfamily protein YfcC